MERSEALPGISVNDPSAGSPFLMASTMDLLLPNSLIQRSWTPRSRRSPPGLFCFSRQSRARGLKDSRSSSAMDNPESIVLSPYAWKRHETALSSSSNASQEPSPDWLWLVS